MPMSPAVLYTSQIVRKSMEAAMSVSVVQGLMDEGLISPEPHRWTMLVEHGFFRKEVRFIRNPSWKPQITDMIYALQNKS